MLPSRVSITDIGRRIMTAAPPSSMSVRVVAIDGPGGAGKSTLAEHVASVFGGAPIVPTDDFASWDEPLEWWPRLLEQVLQPLADGSAACYQRYDWATRRLAEWITVPTSAYVVVEGVSSSRLAFAPYLSYAIWVETPRDVRLARGIARDGEGMRMYWEQWMAEEDRYVAEDRPDQRADLVVAGASKIEHDRSSDVIVLRQGSVR